jgi:hypothetical protein
MADNLQQIGAKWFRIVAIERFKNARNASTNPFPPIAVVRHGRSSYGYSLKPRQKFIGRKKKVGAQTSGTAPARSGRCDFSFRSPAKTWDPGLSTLQ